MPALVAAMMGTGAALVLLGVVLGYLAGRRDRQMREYYESPIRMQRACGHGPETRADGPKPTRRRVTPSPSYRRDEK